MKVLIKTTDPALPSYVKSILEQAEIMVFEFDDNVSIMDGSIGVLPRRIMVADEDYEEAQTLLREAGLGAELEVDDKREKISGKAPRGWIRAFYRR